MLFPARPARSFRAINLKQAFERYHAPQFKVRPRIQAFIVPEVAGSPSRQTRREMRPRIQKHPFGPPLQIPIHVYEY